MNAMHLNAVFEWVVDESDCFITVLQIFCEGPNNSGRSLTKFHEGPDPRTLAGSTLRLWRIKKVERFTNLRVILAPGAMLIFSVSFQF